MAYTKKNLASIDDIDFNKLTKPNLLDKCPYLGTMPTWIAPGDVKILDNNSPQNQDFNLTHHQKYCLSTSQINKLWYSGACHQNRNTNSLPIIAHDGRLVCKNQWYHLFGMDQQAPDHLSYSWTNQNSNVDLWGLVGPKDGD